MSKFQAFSALRAKQFLVEKETPESIFRKRQKGMVCWTACKSLDPLEQEVLIRSYFQDQSLVAIAKELDYCRCHVSRVKASALAKLRDTLDHLAPKGVKKPVTRAKKRKYTGGRGRRKKADSFKSDSLDKVLKMYGT